MLKFPRIETCLIPAQADALAQRDLSAAGCVVFDVLRATTTMNVALSRGAHSIYPVGSVEAAVELRKQNPDWILAGEREGVKIEHLDSEGNLCVFDFGNSPRELDSGTDLMGRRLVMTTTNGTRALEACRLAAAGWIGCLLNRADLVYSLLGKAENLEQFLFVAAGTGEESAIEDVIGIGATLDLWLQKLYPPLRSNFMQSWDDASRIAHATFLKHAENLPLALKTGKNGSRLMKMRDLAADVDYCAKLDSLFTVGVFNAQSNGWITLE